VADFIGETNWLPAEILEQGQGRVRLQTDFASFETECKAAMKAGETVWLGFRPEAVCIGPALVNSLTARIASITYLGEIEQYLLELEGNLKIKAFEQNPTQIRRVGTMLQVHIRPEDLLLLPR
jgi:ABC-type Fe3+/spermidine/putrescine transport system ATPase subunit